MDQLCGIKRKESPNSGKHSNNVYIQKNNDQQNSSSSTETINLALRLEEVARLKRLEMSYAESSSIAK